MWGVQNVHNMSANGWHTHTLPSAFTATLGYIPYLSVGHGLVEVCKSSYVRKYSPVCEHSGSRWGRWGNQGHFPVTVNLQAFHINFLAPHSKQRNKLLLRLAWLSIALSFLGRITSLPYLDQFPRISVCAKPAGRGTLGFVFVFFCVLAPWHSPFSHCRRDSVWAEL